MDISVSAPVKSFNPNSNQIFDLYGNVSEWVHDFYIEKFDGNYTYSTSDQFREKITL